MHRSIFLLFLVLVFFIPFVFKKRITENFDNPGTYIPPPLPESCKTSEPCVFDNGQRLVGCPGGMTDQYVCKDAKTQKQRKDLGNENYWRACPYQCFGEGCKGNWRWDAQVDQETQDVTRCTPPVDGTPGYEQPDVKMGPEYYLPGYTLPGMMSEQESGKTRASMPQSTLMPSEGTLPDMMPEQESGLPRVSMPQRTIMPSEEMPFPKIIDVTADEVIPRYAQFNKEEEQTLMPVQEERRMPVQEERRMFPSMMPEEERLMPVINQEEQRVLKPKEKRYMDKKQKQIKKMMDDQTKVVNSSIGADNPVNINVSYNNNRPLSYNNYDGNGVTDVSKYLFDSGFSK